ncbi:hypothetical protein [Roseiflexus sp.]|uniref:hypothetical protein n=1 Tax=Roseiflexus sp. TaxID=2562120 RepID=UPI00398B76DB
MATARGVSRRGARVAAVRGFPVPIEPAQAGFAPVAKSFSPTASGVDLMHR